MCSPDSLPVVFHLTSTTPSCLPDLVPQSFLNSFLNCFPNVYSLAFNLKPSLLLGCKAVLILDVRLPCVSHSGYWCPTLRISLVTVLVSRFPFMCLPLWLMVSGSPDASPHWSLFTCLPVWLSTASGVRLSWCCLALRVSLFTCLPSCVSHSG